MAAASDKGNGLPFNFGETVSISNQWEYAFYKELKGSARYFPKVRQFNRICLPI